ncbi:MAG: nuclear transport factor 2 family protein [Actinobacteria bacterium]|nr:nuclear transport factor 2 family protein [Actinomycetota bacterium]
MSSARLDGLRFPDRFDIEQLMYRYAKAADMADITTQLTVFHPDCRVRFSGDAWLEGHDALRAAWTNAYTRYRQTSHAVTNISIAFTGTDNANAESLITAWHRDAQGKEWTLHGRYIDTWYKSTEGWKLQTREIVAAGAVGRDEASLTMIERLTMSDGH